MAEKSDIPVDVDVDEMIAKLVEQNFEANKQISGPKIQRVPAFLRQNPDFAKYCSPKVISFGPIHHHNENLKLGQRYKTQWTCNYIEEYGKETSKNTSSNEAVAVAHFVHNIVQDNIRELKELFCEDVIEGYNDKELAWMLFVDGCSLLYFMEHVDKHRPEALNIKLELLLYIWRDINLLENQLPRTLLELLSKKKGADLENLMFNFQCIGEEKQNEEINPDSDQDPDPGQEQTIDIDRFKMAKAKHLLHSTRSIYINNTDIDDDGVNIRNKAEGGGGGGEEDDIWLTYKNIRDLKKAGIRVMANETDEWTWTNISFTSRWFSGELRLPVFCFNDVSPYFFHNVIAYEMCPDFHNRFECCSYFSFMDSLIDDAEDVKELRLAGVLQNWLGSDKELANLFNEIGHYLPANMFHHTRTNAVPCNKKFTQVRLQMEKHCKNKWKTWLADLSNTYFNTPWSFIAFLAALIALVLSFSQTWYTIHPKKT